MTPEMTTLEKELQEIDVAWMSLVEILPDESKQVKIFQKLENEAKAILGEEDSKDEKKLEDKVWEIFEKKYLKGPPNVES